MSRTRNEKLAAVIRQTGWSQAQVATQFVRVAIETGAEELHGITRSHVSQWVLGSHPSGRAADILCEALSRGLGRPVSLSDLGLAGSEGTRPHGPDWQVDTLDELDELGSNDVSMERRHFLESSAFTAAALALPAKDWWERAPESSRSRRTGSRLRVGRSDVEAVNEMVGLFQRRDQRRGGGHGRSAAVAYLAEEVSALLHGSFGDEDVRCDLFSAAGELVYLIGWMAFDAGSQVIAQRYFTNAVKLAAEAEDPALESHVLRAMAHQALDLGHHAPAATLAQASLDERRRSRTSPRERSLLGVVLARSLAATGDRAGASAALLRAECDLGAARPSDDEPGRVFFFGEASLAHETACALRDIGDLAGAQSQFKRSVRTRKADTFTRTHAVTLGYLGAVQAQQGALEAACDTWSRALDAMVGVQSGRARDTVVTMRQVLSPFRHRGVAAAAALEGRATAILRGVV